MSDKPVDVCVIGAGVAGMACAQGLVQAGYTVTLVERVDPLPPVLKAEKIGGEAIQALGRLGFGPALRPVITPLYNVGVYFEQRPLGLFPMTPPEAGCLYHDLVNAMRADLAPAICFRSGHKVVRLDAGTDRATVVLEDGSTVACRLAIVATGEAHSVLAALGGAVEPQVPTSTFVAAFHIAGQMVGPGGSAADSLTYHRPIPGSPVGYATFFRVGPGTRANIFCPGETEERWRRALKERPLAALADENPLIAAQVRDWQVRSPVTTRKANISRLIPPASPRVLVIGDAGHIIDPSSGSGVLLALLEVELLLREYAPRWLGADDLSAAALATLYTDARRVRAAQNSFTGGRYMYDLVQDSTARGTRHRLRFVLRHLVDARRPGHNPTARPLPPWPLPAPYVYEQFAEGPPGWRERVRRLTGS